MGVAIPEHERELFEDVLGSGGIFRRLVTKTDGMQAEFGEEVTVRYTERLLETDVLVSQDQVRQFRIGDGEVMPALELSAKMMRVGEVQEVRCEARFAYGEKGLAPHVPPNAPLKLFLEMLRVGKRVTAEMTSKELLVEATKKKESGNRFFKEENYEQAAKMYKKALKILESWKRSDNAAEDEDDGEQEKDGEPKRRKETDEDRQCKELLVALGNNVANVQHKLGQMKEAKQSSLEVLQIDSKNVKAVYRLAQISLDDSEFGDAARFLKRAIELEPQNVKFREMVATVKSKKEAHKAREKQLFVKLAPPPKASSASSKSDSAGASVSASSSASTETQVSPTRQFIRTHISIISTVVTALIAMLIFTFVGKKHHNMV